LPRRWELLLFISSLSEIPTSTSVTGGTQFGKLNIGYRLWLDEEAFARNPIEELERLYVKLEGESVDDPSLPGIGVIDRM